MIDKKARILELERELRILNTDIYEESVLNRTLRVGDHVDLNGEKLIIESFSVSHWPHEITVNAITKKPGILIKSVAEGKRILAQLHPMKDYNDNSARVNGMLDSLEGFDYKNMEDKVSLLSYISIKGDSKFIQGQIK